MIMPATFLNAYRIASGYLKRKAIVQGLPREITIELTNHCNLRCIMCPRSKMTREKGFMDFTLFKKIIDEVKDYAEVIDLDMFGESTMHPKVFEMVVYCRSNGLKTVLHSNLSYKNGKFSQKLADCGLDMLIVSVDGATKQSYESVRVGAEFENVIKNIEVLGKKKKKNPFIVVQMIYMEQNKHEVKRFFDFWRYRKTDSVRIRPYENLDQGKTGLNALTLKNRLRSKPCFGIWYKMNVAWNGDVLLCCNDYDGISVLGNSESATLREIWNNDTYALLREKHALGQRADIPLCRNCLPLEVNSLLIMGSILFDTVTLRRWLFIMERLLILNEINFISF